MPDTPTRNPLAWPTGWKRTAAGSRAYGKFGTQKQSGNNGWKRREDLTIAQASRRLQEELERMGVRSDTIILSSNLRLDIDGSVRSAQAQPQDPGCAVYWTDGKQQRCMAIDMYTRVEQNIAALAATIEAMRAIERYGGASILDRAFTGFTALPASIVAGMKRDWSIVLGLAELLAPTADDVQQAYRRLAAKHHPDRGGDPAAMAELNQARDEALREIAS